MKNEILNVTPPARPGVYFFRDGRKRPLYIGKAKSLADRLGSYRQKALPSKTMAMLEAAMALDWIVLNSELEALLCEAALIRQYKPRYNIDLKDDKRYPMILLTDEPFPKALKVRRAHRGAGRHFGPFSGLTANHLLEIVSRRFRIRRCGGPLPKRTRPCIDFDIGRCDAPCVANLSREDYAKLVEDAARFLSGDVASFIREFEAEMKIAAVEQDFEKAASLRDEIAALRDMRAKQEAERPGREDADAVTVVSTEPRAETGGASGDADPAATDEIAIGVVLARRNGVVMDRKSYVFDLPVETTREELLSRTCLAHYADHPPPPRILVEDEPAEDILRQALLTLPLADSGSRIAIHAPKRGPDAALVKISRQNGLDALERETRGRTHDLRNSALDELTRLLELERPPTTIEGVDIATFAGKDTVGALVQFQNGLPRKTGYRLFRIRGRQDSDVDAIAEVLARRAHAKDRLPDLFLIDGGMGQLKAARDALMDSGGRSPDEVPMMISLEKREELIRTLEGEIIRLERRSPALRLLQQIRDEAHRFGGNYHRKLRGKIEAP
jgi:excinuclease ABC subunit C